LLMGWLRPRSRCAIQPVNMARTRISSRIAGCPLPSRAGWIPNRWRQCDEAQHPTTPASLEPGAVSVGAAALDAGDSAWLAGSPHLHGMRAHGSTVGRGRTRVQLRKGSNPGDHHLSLDLVASLPLGDDDAPPLQLSADCQVSLPGRRRTPPGRLSSMAYQQAPQSEGANEERSCTGPVRPARPGWTNT
jgi:hypothetical protein